MIRGLVVFLSVLGSVLMSPAFADDKNSKQWMVGTELDLLPYLFGGYYVSAVAGYGHWRARLVSTELTTPDFVTPSGFEDNNLDVTAYIIDYYFKPGFKGWWISPGYETWKGDIKETSSGVRKNYQTDILTLGGGYTYHFNDYLYINPWAAVHIPIGGDKEVRFAQDTYKIKTTPEASIKIGIHF